MKNLKLKIITAVISCLMLSSCVEDRGTTSVTINGDEQNLPDELKGLKIYSVSTGKSYIKVAVLNGKTNSTTYNVGKIQESTIILNKQNDNLIKVSQILLENDSLIICRK